MLLSNAKIPTLGSKILENIKCPVGYGIFLDPVVIDCGHAFERDEIEQVSSCKCPLCVQPFSKPKLTPNISIQQVTQSFLKEYPEYIKDQYVPEGNAVKQIKLGNTDNFEQEILKSIQCPISRKIFLDPVVIDCGHTFERNEIEQVNPRKCYCCGEPFTKLTPNISIKQVTQSFLEEHPKYIKKQYFSKENTVKQIELGNTQAVITALKNRPNEPLNDSNSTALFLAVEHNHLIMVKALFMMIAGADINATDARGWTPLHMAVSNKDIKIEIINLLLQNKANPNAPANDGGTPLHTATINSRSPEVFKQLLEAGADISAKATSDAYKDWTPLHAAVKNNNPIAVQALLENGADIDAKTAARGWTPLHMAVSNKDIKIEIINLLLQNKADPNALANDGGTPLHTATINSRSPEVFKQLLEAGADISAKATSDAYKDWTPLHAAVKNNNPIAVQALLENGADIDAKTAKKDTPLHFITAESDKAIVAVLVHYAVHGNNVNALQQLITDGADINVKAANGWTPLYRALCNENIDIEIITLLLKNKANPNISDEHGVTPLHTAAKNSRNPNVFKQLLNAGATISAQSTSDEYKGWTPLHVAVKNNNPVAVQALLENGADIDAKTAKKGTPLHFITAESDKVIIALLVHTAIKKNNLGALQQLITAGADINATDARGWTPLHMAVSNKDIKIEIINLLLQNKADPNALANDGGTPLHAAIQYNNAVAVEALLKQDAAIDAKTTAGDTPLDFVTPGSDKAMVALLVGHAIKTNNAAALQKLINANADLNEKTADFVTTQSDRAVVELLVRYAIRTNNVDVLRQLITPNATIRAKNEKKPIDIYKKLNGKIEHIVSLVCYSKKLAERVKNKGENSYHYSFNFFGIKFGGWGDYTAGQKAEAKEKLAEVILNDADASILSNDKASKNGELSSIRCGLGY